MQLRVLLGESSLQNVQAELCSESWLVPSLLTCCYRALMVWCTGDCAL
jgi:hypothetical protein